MLQTKISPEMMQRNELGQICTLLSARNSVCSSEIIKKVICVGCFLDVLFNFSCTAQTQAKMSYESQMVSEIKLVKPDVTQEEVNRIMAQDDPSRIFQQVCGFEIFDFCDVSSRKCWEIWISREQSRTCCF